MRQTRLFRGKLLEVLALEHLYTWSTTSIRAFRTRNWPKLARRLDPYFERMGLKPIRLLF